QPNVLLRAPRLTVGFDAWKSMRSGHLEAGLITLIAPDIDVEHFMSRAAHASAVAASSGARARFLQRWRDGRIDIQGGALRLPAPTENSDGLTIQIRRAAIRRAGEEWNFFALVYLP